MQKRLDRKNHYFIFLLILISIVGIILTTFVTSKWGAGLTPDSAAYIAGAKNILNGNGVAVLYNDKDGNIPLKLWASSESIEKPLIFHWPPLYPIVLSIIKFFGLNLMNGARFLNIFLFGINIFLISYIVKDYTKSTLLSLFTAIIMLSSDVMLNIHTNIEAEPIFLFTGFLGLFLLVKYLDKKKISLLIISAFFISLAFLSRYIGIALVMAGTVGILFFNNENIKKKIIKSVIFIIISCLPISIWLVRTMIVGKNLTDRRIVFHPISLDEIKAVPGIILRWFLARDLLWMQNWIAFSFFIIIVIAGFVVIWRKKIEGFNKSQFFKIVLLLYIFIVNYMFFLIISKTFFDAKIPVAQDRLLFPVLVSFLVIGVLFIHGFLSLFNKNIVVRVFVFIILVIISGSYVYNCISWSNNAYKNGQGYARKYFLQSEIIEEIKKLPDSKIIYTDATDIIYLFAGRVSYVLPVERNPYTTEINDNYQSQIKKMFEEINNRKGVIVDFYGMERLFLPTISELKKEKNLCLLSKKSDGEILEVCSKKTELIYRMDYSNFEDYWRPMNQCEFKIKDSNVLIEVSGDDPWFESKFPIECEADFSLTLLISIYSNIEGEIRIFYGRKGKVYIWEDSYNYQLSRGDNEIYFTIPYSDDLEKVRIDPINKDQDCIIKKIELYTVQE